MVRSPCCGAESWASPVAGQNGGHGRDFGTMTLAVNDRAMPVLGLEGDEAKYPYYDYGKGEGLPRP